MNKLVGSLVTLHDYQRTLSMQHTVDKLSWLSQMTRCPLQFVSIIIGALHHTGHLVPDVGPSSATHTEVEQRRQESESGPGNADEESPVELDMALLEIHVEVASHEAAIQAESKSDTDRSSDDETSENGSDGERFLAAAAAQVER